MPTFVALLRGVNVGKAKRVPMAEWRDMLEGMGYTDVSTLLNSGNAVFHATSGAPARHAKDIATSLAARLNVDVPVVVKTADEIAAIVADNPIAVEDDGHARLLVVYAQQRDAIERLASLEPLIARGERFAIGRDAAYLFCAAGILQSKAGEALLGKAGREVTTRNWATTLKLHALAGAGSH